MENVFIRAGGAKRVDLTPWIFFFTCEASLIVPFALGLIH